MKKNKTDVLTYIRCTPEFKQMAISMAEEKGVSLATYVRLLIIQEAEHQKIENIVRA